jgi:hypothetical protein
MLKRRASAAKESAYYLDLFINKDAPREAAGMMRALLGGFWTFGWLTWSLVYFFRSTLSRKSSK